jgi:DNA replication protein DnaC
MEPKYEIVEKRCIDCGKAFDSKVFSILSVKRSFDGGRCPDCRAAWADHSKAAEHAARELEYAKVRLQFKNQSGIPPRYIERTFEQFDKGWRGDAYQDCIKYADNFPISDPRKYKSLVLYSKGTWGVGKSFLAAAIGNRIIERWKGERCGCPIYFISEPDLFRSIRATYSYNNEEKVRLDSEEDIINRCIGVKLLILDDVGKESVGDMTFVQRILFAIINGRYNAYLPMVITANLDIDEMRLHLGANVGNEAAYDRIIEMSGGLSIKMAGKSFRRIQKLE